MKRKISFLSAVGVVCLVTCGAAYAQQQSGLIAAVDKRSAEVNEEINLTVKITGAQGNVPAPRIPVIRGCDTYYTGRASHFTFVNGQSTSSVEFSYVLVPRQEGKLILPPLEVDMNGRKFRTEPLEIMVAGKASRAPYNPPPQTNAAPFPSAGQAQPAAPVTNVPPSAPPPQAQADSAPPVQNQDENIFVKAWVDKNRVYPNEQVLLSYSLYTRYDTRYEGFEEEPEVSGFWIEEFPPDQEVPRETVQVGGLRYVKADVKKVALFPTAPAEYTIQPGSIKVSIRQEAQGRGVFDDFFNDNFFSGGGFFSRRENRLLKPPPIHVTVVPFPEQGKPENFQGAVGNFRLSATVDKDTVKQNEPVTVKMLIQGEGNIETLNKPKVPELKGVKVYDADTSSQLFKTGNIIGGKKTFETVFIPTEPGRLTIPKLELSFFNPVTRSYQVMTTPEFSVKVEKSDQTFSMPAAISQQEAFKKDVKVEGKDIRYIQERLPAERETVFFDYAVRAVAGADILLVFLLGTGFWRSRQDRIFAKDNTLKRRRLARQVAERNIRKFKKLLRSNDPNDVGAYFEAIDKTLTQYLSDKFGLSAYGITRNDLEIQLVQSLGEEDPLYQEIMELFQFCDESRFARADLPHEQKHKALKILKDTILRVEKVRR